MVTLFLWLFQAVQQVISNLLIAQIEVCAEDSPEIQPYSHERQVEKIVVPLGEELMEIQNTYIKVSDCISFLVSAQWQEMFYHLCLDLQCLERQHFLM